MAAKKKQPAKKAPAKKAPAKKKPAPAKKAAPAKKSAPPKKSAKPVAQRPDATPAPVNPQPFVLSPSTSAPAKKKSPLRRFFGL